MSETFGQKPVGGDGGGGIPSLYLSFRIFTSDRGASSGLAPASAV